MAEAIVIIIFIIAFGLVMNLVLYLIRHPNININLEGKVLAHEPMLEEYSYRVLTYLHEEEKATMDEIIDLFDSEEVAEDVVSFLYRRDEIDVITDDEGTTIITLNDE